MEDVAAEAGITRLIVYRHFDSKEDLYRGGAQPGHRAAGRGVGARAWRARDRGYVFRTLLTVAREQPDGYRLLFEHAAREPQFRTFAERGPQPSRWPWPTRSLGENMPDPAFRRWATRTVVGYLNDSVLAWLEVGDPGPRRRSSCEPATDGLVAMSVSWTGAATSPEA